MMLSNNKCQLQDLGLWRWEDLDCLYQGLQPCRQ